MVFRTPGGRRSHQRQKNHQNSSTDPPAPVSPVQEYCLDPEALNEAAKLLKKRAKKERQRQRRHARYELIKELVLKLVAERGVDTVLGVDSTCSARSSSQQAEPTEPTPAAVIPPDPVEVDRLLSIFINSLLDDDEKASPDSSDLESTASGRSSPYFDKVASDSDSDSDSGSGSSSGSNLGAEDSDTGQLSVNDAELTADSSYLFEPVVKDGEIDQSSTYFRTCNSTMDDSMAQLEMSLADLSMQDGMPPNAADLQVSEPIGDYSFLNDSPVSSRGTTTPPHRFFDDSMIDTSAIMTQQTQPERSDQSDPLCYDEFVATDAGSEFSVSPRCSPDISIDGTVDAGANSSMNSDSRQDHVDSPAEVGPGAPIGECLPLLERLHQEKIDSGLSPAHPFADWLEFEFVKWMIERDISQGNRERLLKLPLIATRAKLSFTSNYTLNKLLENLPLPGPKWDVKAVTITGDKLGPDGKNLTEVVELWHRDILGVIQELLENVVYGKDLVFAAREEWVDGEQTERRYDEMWTGTWWQKLQASPNLPPGATIIPVILATDATHLTNFGGGKQAYPVYITLGNIPKSIRRKPSSYGTLLLGYLPAQKLECFTKKGKAHQKERLFHQCMSEIVKPLVKAGKEGVEMACGDGKIRKCFPILAAYTADNPEQTLVACCKRNLCYRCTVERDRRGEHAISRDRDHVDSANALISQSKHRTTQYYVDNGLRPFGSPFWADLPHCNIYGALTPDILHQLHKGVFKDHVMNWCLKLANMDEAEFNDRYKAMPDHSSLRHFSKNVSELSQTTGKEHREMEKVFLGVMAGLVPNDVMPVLRALLDFIYYAQLPAHTDTTISWLEEALRQFHESKHVFIDRGVRTHFNINKLHSMIHYASAIRELGALDGYNTEGPERLHIDFAKRAYKATNRNDFLAQMVQYLERREQVFKFDAYLKWAIPEYAATEMAKDESSAARRIPGWHIAQESPFRPVAQDRLHEIFGVRWLDWAVGEFFEEEFNRDIELDPRDKITVYPKATQFIRDDLTNGEGFIDIVHASPHSSMNRLSFERNGSKFDTVFIRKPATRAKEFSYGIGEHFVGQVRMIFTLPEHYGVFDPLVCVYMFRAPNDAPIQLTGMHRDARPCPLAPLDIPQHDPAEEAELTTITIGGQQKTSNNNLVQVALFLVSHFDCSERHAAGILEQVLSGFPNDDPVESAQKAVQQFYHSRQYTLETLELVLNSAMGVNPIEPSIRTRLADYVLALAGTTTDLGKGKRGMLSEKVLQQIDTSTALMQKQQANQRNADSTTVIGANNTYKFSSELYASVVVAIQDERQLLGHLLFILGGSSELRTSEVIRMVSWLAAVSPDEPLMVYVLASCLAALDASTPLSSDDALVGLMKSELAKPTWRIPEVKDVLMIKWCLFIIDTSNGDRPFESAHGYTEAEIERLVTNTVRSDALRYLAALLHSARPLDQVSMDTLSLDEVVDGLSAACPDSQSMDPVFYRYLLRQVELFVISFVTSLSPVLRCMRHANEDTGLALSTSHARQPDSRTASHANPQQPSRSGLADLFNLIAVIYANQQPDEALKWWTDLDARLYAFLRWAAEARVTSLLKPLYNMLGSLARGPGCATYVYNFFSTNSGQFCGGAVLAGSGWCSWASLFGSLDWLLNSVPDQRTQARQTGAGGALMDIGLGNRQPLPVDPEEIRSIMAFLRVLRVVARYSTAARAALLENNQYCTVAVMLDLVRSPSC